jgi:hypothetical protein
VNEPPQKQARRTPCTAKTTRETPLAEKSQETANRGNGLGHPRRAEVLVVGDRLTSDIGGRGYGLDTCWFNPTATARPADATSTYEIRHLNERAGLLL